MCESWRLCPHPNPLVLNCLHKPHNSLIWELSGPRPASAKQAQGRTSRASSGKQPKGRSKNSLCILHQKAGQDKSNSPLSKRGGGASAGKQGDQWFGERPTTWVDERSVYAEWKIKKKKRNTLPEPNKLLSWRISPFVSNKNLTLISPILRKRYHESRLCVEATIASDESRPFLPQSAATWSPRGWNVQPGRKAEEWTFSTPALGEHAPSVRSLYTKNGHSGVGRRSGNLVHSEPGANGEQWGSKTKEMLTNRQT